MTPSNIFLSKIMATDTVFDRTGEGFLGFVGVNQQNLETSHTAYLNSDNPEAHIDMRYWQSAMSLSYDFGLRSVFYDKLVAKYVLGRVYDCDCDIRNGTRQSPASRFASRSFAPSSSPAIVVSIELIAQTLD